MDSFSPCPLLPLPARRQRWPKGGAVGPWNQSQEESPGCAGPGPAPAVRGRHASSSVECTGGAMTSAPVAFPLDRVVLRHPSPLRDAVQSLSRHERRRMATALERRLGLHLPRGPARTRERLERAWLRVMQALQVEPARTSDTRRAQLVAWLRRPVLPPRADPRRGLPVFGPHHRLRHRAPETRFGRRVPEEQRPAGGLRLDRARLRVVKGKNTEL